MKTIGTTCMGLLCSFHKEAGGGRRTRRLSRPKAAGTPGKSQRDAAPRRRRRSPSPPSRPHAAPPPPPPPPPGLKVTSARSRSHFGRATEQHHLSPLREGPGPSGAGLPLAAAERSGKGRKAAARPLHRPPRRGRPRGPGGAGDTARGRGSLPGAATRRQPPRGTRSAGSRPRRKDVRGGA